MTKRLLLLTDKDLGILSKGNITRIRTLLLAFSRFNYDITLICAGLSIHDDLRKICREVICVRDWFDGGGIMEFRPDSYITATEEVVRSFPPTIAIVEYAWMTVCLDHIPGPCIKMVDTHDILYIHARQYREAGLIPWIDCTKEEEVLLLNKADVVIAIQQTEQQHLQELLPGKPVIFLPHLGEIHSMPALDSNPVIGFIGSAHAGNKGILEFIRHSWPSISEKVPNCTLLIAGSATDWIDETDRITIMPFAEDLDSFYHSVSIIICPVLMGTGLKIKLVEAFLYGKASVITVAAAEGLPPANGTPYLQANDWVSFAQCVIQICTDSQRREKMQEDAIAYAKEYFSFEAGISKVEAITL